VHGCGKGLSFPYKTQAFVRRSAFAACGKIEDERMSSAFAPLCLSLALLALSACSTLHVEPFGGVQLSALCNDTRRCEARGDKVFNLLTNKRSPRLDLAPQKGPEQVLGKVAPKRKIDSVLKSCGKEVTPSDWLASAEAIRELPLDAEGKAEVQSRLRATLSSRAGALHLSGEQMVEATLREVIGSLQLKRASWVSRTYWLSDVAFERRVGQCGEEERKDIVYSLTVLEPSQGFQSDLAKQLEQALRAQLEGQDEARETDVDEADVDEAAESAEQAGEITQEATSEPGAEPGAAEAATSEPPAEARDGADASERMSYEALALDVVTSFARNTRVVVALGFDEP
jgi:hypothetical protein